MSITWRGREWPTGNCRSCRAEILWCVTKNGKKNPIDVRPSPEGNIVLDGVVEDDRGRESPRATTLRRDEDPGPVPRFTSHFSTCPDAADHRQR